MAVEAEAMVIQTRQLLATFFGFSGPANRVIFTANVTDSLNMALSGLLTQGDHLLTSRLEHNAVLRTAEYLKRQRQIDVTQVPASPTGVICVDAMREAIQPNTKALVVNHASNVTGRVQPLSDLGQLARDHKIPLILDSAQTAGVLPIDMQSQGISILTFTGHKGLFGPMGIGGLIVDESIDLQVTKYGGNGILSESVLQPDIWPHRHEVGTLAVPAIAGLHAAQRWFNALGDSMASPYGITGANDARKLTVELDEHAINKPLDLAKHTIRAKDAVQQIHRTELKHLAKLIDTLTAYDHVRILGSVDTKTLEQQVSTLSFVSKKVSTERIAAALDADFHVCLRAGLHCAPLVHTDEQTLEEGGAIRLAPGYFTDEQDMTQLLDGLKDVLN